MLSDKPVVTLQFIQTVSFFFVMSLSQAIKAFASFIPLSFLLNGCIFFNLSDIIDYIHNNSIGLKHVKLYYNMIKQIAEIFEIELFFASNFIKVVKKDKRWQNKE